MVIYLFIYSFIPFFIAQHTTGCVILKGFIEKLRRKPSWPTSKFYPTLVWGTEEKQEERIIPPRAMLFEQ